MAQNGGTPELPEAVSKPPEGVVLPPKDIRGGVIQSGHPFPDNHS
jgi:hypothetical protein